jgi:hypothetical protein
MTPPRYWRPGIRQRIGPYGRGACYANALHLAEQSGSRLRYVEGWAVPAELPIVQIPHAWAVTRAGIVIDTTWSRPGVAYFGTLYATRRARQRLEAGLPWEWMEQIERTGRF